MSALGRPEPPRTADHGDPLPAGQGIRLRGPRSHGRCARLLGGARPAAGPRRKGHIRHQAEGLRYVYVPVVAREKAKRAAVKHVLDTFFNGSPEQIVAALLDVSSPALTREELDRMAEMIEKARKEGK